MPPMPDQDSVAAWVNLGQAAHVVQAVLDQRLEATAGISGSEFELLWRLSLTPGERLQMTEIAGLLLASKSGITRLVDRLVEAGLVERETPRDNRRVTYAQLTVAGTAVVTRANATFREALEDAFSRHLSETDVHALRRVLRKLLVANGAWVHDRCEPALTDKAG